VEDVALHRNPRQLRPQAADLHLLGAYHVLVAGALQFARAMRLDPVAQGLLDHSQAACRRRLTLTRLNKPRRFLLELQRITHPFRLRHLRYPFALEQLAKGYVLQGQGHCGSKSPSSQLGSAFFSCSDREGNDGRTANILVE
jgi:hypothetical protein